MTFFSFFARKRVKKRVFNIVALGECLNLRIHPTFKVLASDCQEEEVHLNDYHFLIVVSDRLRVCSVLKQSIVGTRQEDFSVWTTFIRRQLATA